MYIINIYSEGTHNLRAFEWTTIYHSRINNSNNVYVSTSTFSTTFDFDRCYFRSPLRKKDHSRIILEQKWFANWTMEIDFNVNREDEKNHVKYFYWIFLNQELCINCSIDVTSELLSLLTYVRPSIQSYLVDLSEVFSIKEMQYRTSHLPERLLCYPRVLIEGYKGIPVRHHIQLFIALK